MELNEAVDELRKDIRQFNDESLTPIKERLASLEERNSAPGDETVTDLEKRLLDAEQKQEAMAESLRLAQVNGGLIPAVEKNSDPFKGFLFHDIDAVRHELLHGDTRAVNLAAIASAGKLTDETASAFLDYVVGDQPTLSVIEKRTMSSPTARLDRIGVGTRKLVTTAENTDVSDTNAITFGTHTLSVVEANWGENLSLSFIEDNIAGAGAEGQIAAVVAKAIGEELNDLLWNGSDDDGSEWIKINKGLESLFVTDSDSAVTDVDMSSGATTALLCLNKLYKGMPTEYRTISDQRIFASPGLATVYLDELGGRDTALGDSTIVGGAGGGLRYYGIPITVDRHLDADKVYMTPASNLVFGVHRDVTQEMEWRPRPRHIELTVSLRFDFEYKFGGVVSRGHTIDAGLE